MFPCVRETVCLGESLKMHRRPITAARNQIAKILSAYPLWAQKRQFERQSFRQFNERAVELAFIFRQLTRIYPRKVLDVGTGTNALPQLMRSCGCLVTATDNIRDYWPTGMVNLHYHIVDDDITSSHLEDTFDLVTCISVLEHIPDPDVAVRNMFRLLNEKAYLIMTFPYTEHTYHPNVYTLPDARRGKNATYVCQSYSRRELDRWLQQNGGVLVEQEYWQFWEGEYWAIGNQLIPPRQVRPEERHQLSCVLIQKERRVDRLESSFPRA